MDGGTLHPLPARDPVSGGELVITELQGPETGITIRGRFEMPRFAQLNADQSRYLETFLRCRGMLNSVERELGISYPTARARLDAVLRALDLHGGRDDLPPMPVEPPEPASEVSFGIDEPASSLAEESIWESPIEEQPFAEVYEEEEVLSAEPPRSRNEILTLLERGEITPEQAKRELGVTK